MASTISICYTGGCQGQHCSRRRASHLGLDGLHALKDGFGLGNVAAGDDATRATWLDVNPSSESRYAYLYASHRQWVDRVAESLAPHEKARADVDMWEWSTEHRTDERNVYPPREVVPDAKVPWAVPFEGYNPTDFTAPAVLKNAASATGHVARWAENEWTGHTIEDSAVKPTFEGPIQFDPTNGRPLNPRGRTGLAGRGLLGRWGPNAAVDPIVTRLHPQTNRLQVVVVKRPNSHEWGLPGSFRKIGVPLGKALRNAFEPKAVNFLGQKDEQERMRILLDDLFFRDVEENTVYRGYVDDPRNTDNVRAESRYP